MRHGSNMGYGFYGAYILAILIVLIIVLLIVLLIYKRKRNSPFEKIIQLLKERYVRDEISGDEFRKKRAVIEELDVRAPILIPLVDRYVKGEISSEEFFVILEEIKK